MTAASMTAADAYDAMLLAWGHQEIEGRRAIARGLALKLLGESESGKIRLAGKQLCNIVAVIRATERGEKP